MTGDHHAANQRKDGSNLLGRSRNLNDNLVSSFNQDYTCHLEEQQRQIKNRTIHISQKLLNKARQRQNVTNPGSNFTKTSAFYNPKYFDKRFS